MKKLTLFVVLLVVAASSWAFYPKASEAPGSMMVISRISLGFDARASIVTVNPDGTQQEKEVDYRRVTAKQMAANMTEVHKAALLTVNQYQVQGWRIVSAVPNEILQGGNTVFSQTIYILEKH